MTTGISITVNARDIPDLAAQLLDLHHRFNGIAALQTTPADDVNHGHSLTLPPTPLEAAIDKSKDATPPEKEGAKRRDAAPLGERKTGGKKTAAEKPAVAQPKDRFFEDEAAQQTVATAAPPAANVSADERAAQASYAAALPTEEAYLNLRAKAKLYMDSAPEGEGPTRLRNAWDSNWAAICPEKKDETPGLKHIAENRDAILRALAIFDALNGIDPITGEETLSDPAEDLM